MQIAQQEAVRGSLERLRVQSERARELNGSVFAFSHLAEWDEATAERQIARAGPLSGLSVSVKGNIPVDGMPYTEGSRLFHGRVAHHDAAVVAAARNAGAYIQGTTTLSELAMYGVRNAYETMGLNPWDAERTAGGSSTGAGVAAALDLADVNIGTDGGGSIRNPAIHCGAVGFMPSSGVISAEGKTRYSRTVESIGLIARSVEMVKRGLLALGNPEPRSAHVTRRLLVPSRFVETMADAATRSIFDEDVKRLEKAGFELIEDEIGDWIAADRAAGIASLHEGGQVLSGMDLAKAGEGIRRRFEAFKGLDAATLEYAQKGRDSFRSALAGALERHDACGVLTPGWPFAAPLIDAETIEVNGKTVPLDPHRNCFVRPANAVNACALTIPTTLYADEGVPASVQVLGRNGRDMDVIEISLEIENTVRRFENLNNSNIYIEKIR